MPRNIKLTIEYDGTHFHGWQIQSNNQRTIQGVIQQGLKRILGEDVKVIGSGRTDQGVHALAQVAHFHTKSSLVAKELQNALNANLPDDVNIIKVEDVPLSFHAQYSVKSKTYRYTILNRDCRSSLQRQHILFYPYKLNLTRMREEAKTLVGRHNFKAFQSSDPHRSIEKQNNTIRTIKKLMIKKSGELIIIDIEADGFLYKMVRNIVGCLLDIGRQRLSKGILKRILQEKEKKISKKPVKPQGLMLLKVCY